MLINKEFLFNQINMWIISCSRLKSKKAIPDETEKIFISKSQLTFSQYILIGSRKVTIKHFTTHYL